MRRCLALVAAVLLLSGCESFGDLNSDAFEPGTATQSRYSVDDSRCRERGNLARNVQIAGIDGTHRERHEIYNRAYARCMAQSGYARRDWSPDIPSPYDIDPTP
jgi:hypothetical protein